jgi:hypothetical protein
LVGFGVQRGRVPIYCHLDHTREPVAFANQTRVYLGSRADNNTMKLWHQAGTKQTMGEQAETRDTESTTDPL